MVAKKVRARESGGGLALSWLVWLAAAVWGGSALPVRGAEEAAPAGGGKAAPAGGGKAAQVEEILRRIDLSSQERKALARNALAIGKRFVEDLDYASAETALLEALRYDPNLAEASRLLEQVQFLQGRRVGDRALALQIFDQALIQREQTRVEIERLYTEGLRLQGEGKYGQAIGRFERVVEGIRYAAFPLNLDKTLHLAQQKIGECQQLAQEAARLEKGRLEHRALEEIQREKVESARYVGNRIRSLKKSAKEAFDAKQYTLAETLCKQILQIRASDVWAQRLGRKAAELRHLTRQYETFKTSLENWDLLMLDLAEASIPYQKIFNYPTRREWERISAKRVSLEERVAASESAADREIRQKIRQTMIPEIGFEDRPFSEVLEVLRQLSGINFVLNKDAKDAVEGGLTVSLDTLRNVTLEQVLKLLMERLGAQAEFGYQIQSGAILIGPRESLRSRHYLEFYDVTDIVGEHPTFKAPPISIRSAGEGEEAGLGGGSTLEGLEGEEPKTGIEVQKLVELIEKILTNEAGEEEGTVKPQGGKLVVRTTLENHRKIADLLESLRRLTGVMVTCSSRFLDIQNNFLESIGVDMGSPVETRLDSSIPDVNGVGTALASGYEFIDAQGVSDFRAATLGSFSEILGTEIAPFNISSLGGMAIQYNVLEVYQLEAILTAVAKDQEVRSLDEPRVTTFDGQNAYTMVVDQIAYVKDVEVNQTGVSPVINPVIGSFRVGSILEIRPTVSHDRKYVILEVKPTIAEHVDSKFSQLTLAGGNTIVQVELPVIMMSQINSTITIPDGGSVLVGGLRRVFERQRSVGIPIIRHIPVLNLLLGRAGRSVLRNNLFVLLNANITVVREEERKTFGVRAGG